MNTLELNDPVPEIAAEPAASSTLPPALPALPQAATLEITPPNCVRRPAG